MTFLPVFRPSHRFLPREILAVKPVDFLPVFLLTVLVAVAYKVAFGATFEHSLEIQEMRNKTPRQHKIHPRPEQSGNSQSLIHRQWFDNSEAMSMDECSMFIDRQLIF